MAKQYICGLSARKKLGCTKERFLNLVNKGEIEAERLENGSWKVSNASVDAYIAKRNPIARLELENKFLKEQVEHYKKLLEQIKRIIPEDL